MTWPPLSKGGGREATLLAPSPLHDPATLDTREFLWVGGRERGGGRNGLKTSPPPP